MSWFGFGKSKEVKEIANSDKEKVEQKYEPFTDDIFDKFIAVCTEESSDWSTVFEDQKKEITVWTKKVLSSVPLPSLAELFSSPIALYFFSF